MKRIEIAALIALTVLVAVLVAVLFIPLGIEPAHH